MTTREEREADCALARELSSCAHAALLVRPLDQRPADWNPEQATCHRSADVWAERNPGWRVVRGWVNEVELAGVGPEYLSHSAVRDPDGALREVTKLDGRERRLIVHLGPEDEFLENCKSGRWVAICENRFDDPTMIGGPFT